MNRSNISVSVFLYLYSEPWEKAVNIKYQKDKNTEGEETGLSTFPAASLFHFCSSLPLHPLGGPGCSVSTLL